MKKRNTSPAFSVIMPVRNRAAIVEKAIQSVFDQTLKDFELLIIDDGSEDGLSELVHPYLSETVRYYRLPRKGLSIARNHGLNNANGRYIAYLDSDNSWHPDFLAKMAQALRKPFFRAKAAYCQCNLYRKDPDASNMTLIGTRGRPFNKDELAQENYIDLNTFVHAKKCLTKSGLFDENLNRLVDWDFILRITQHYRPVFLEHVLVDYHLDMCANSVTLTEDLSSPFAIIRAKYTPRTARFQHDEINYTFKNISEKKFLNYLKMSHQCRHDIFHRIQAKSLPPVASSFAAPGFPYVLQIEPTTLCNLSCPLCPVSDSAFSRDRRHMRLKEFQSIIDDMQEYLLFLILWDWGEPLMNPEFPEMISYASDRNIQTVTSTNAHFFLDDDYTERILTSGLTTLIIAIDSLQDEEYRSYRRGGNLAKALKGLENLVRIKRKVKSKTILNLRMVIMRSNEQEVPAMRDYARKINIDTFTVKTVNPSCGLKAMDDEVVPLNPAYRRYTYDAETDERIRIPANCERVWFMSNVFSNGDVIPCCYDYNSEQKVGNVFEKPFSEIWNSPSYLELRKKIYFQKHLIPKCNECGINFKLSQTGWFVESHDFNPAIRKQFKK